MKNFRYQIGIAGKNAVNRDNFAILVRKRVAEIGIAADSLEIFFDEQIMENWERKAPFVLVFFGERGENLKSYDFIEKVRESSVPVVPVVENFDDFSNKVPPEFKGINGLKVDSAADLERLVSTCLENIGLLREDRRVFISYKRDEATNIAAQLYEEFDSRGFNAFLDTRSVAPARDFQSELWHNLADSDIVVLLNTPGFRDSHWAVQELTQANATNIQILHMLWPDVDPDASSAFSDFMPMPLSSFDDGKADKYAKLTKAALSEVMTRAESLRARALAARYNYLVDSFCDIARETGSSVDVNPERYLSVKKAGTEKIVFPAIGIPNAQRLENLERRFRGVENMSLNVIYDERGILQSWHEHLAWLNAHLPIRTIKLNEVTKSLLAN